MLIALHPPRWARRTAPLVALSVLIAACSTGVTGESWAGIALSSDGKAVYLAYQDKLFRLDTASPNVGSTTHWGYQIPNNVHSYQPPALSDSALYIGGYDGKVYGFDQTTGQPIAGFTTINTGDKIIGGVTYDKASDLVYSPTGAKGIGAFNPKTGQEVAHFDDTTYGVWAAPLVLGDTVYAASLDHNLYALDTKTLALRWKIDLGGAVADTPVYDGQHTLYIGTFNSEVLAIDVSGTTNNVASPLTPTASAPGSATANATAAATSSATLSATAISTASATQTATQTATQPSTQAATSVATAAATTPASTSAATSATTSGAGAGKIVHRFKAANWVWGSPVIDNSVLYFGDLNGVLYALDANTFAVKWQAQDKANSGGIRGRVAVVDNVKVSGGTAPLRLVLTGNENKRLYAYDAATGNQIWVSALVLNDRILSNMVVTNVTDSQGVTNQEVLFTTMSEDQILVALNVQTGQIQWQLKLSDLISTLIPTPHP